MTNQVPDIEFLKPPPMANEDISLYLEQTIPADHEEGFVPIYRFAIHTAQNIRVGNISFKVGDVAHITRYVGHIGFEILPEFRGGRFANKSLQSHSPLRCPMLQRCHHYGQQ